MTKEPNETPACTLSSRKYHGEHAGVIHLTKFARPNDVRRDQWAGSHGGPLVEYHFCQKQGESGISAPQDAQYTPCKPLGSRFGIGSETKFACRLKAPARGPPKRRALAVA